MKRLLLLSVVLLAGCTPESHEPRVIGPVLAPRFTFIQVSTSNVATYIYVAHDSVTGAEFLVSSQGGICPIPQ